MEIPNLSFKYHKFKTKNQFLIFLAEIYIKSLVKMKCLLINVKNSILKDTDQK